MHRSLRIHRDDWARLFFILKIMAYVYLVAIVLMFLVMEGISRAINADLDAAVMTFIGAPTFFIFCYLCYALMLHFGWTVGYRYTLLKPTIPALCLSACTLPQLLQNIALNNSPYQERTGIIKKIFGEIKLPSKSWSSNPFYELGYKSPEAADAWYTSSIVQYGLATLFGMIFAGMCLNYFMRKSRGY